MARKLPSKPCCKLAVAKEREMIAKRLNKFAMSLTFEQQMELIKLLLETMDFKQ